MPGLYNKLWVLDGILGIMEEAALQNDALRVDYLNSVFERHYNLLFPTQSDPLGCLYDHARSAFVLSMAMFCPDHKLYIKDGQEVMNNISEYLVNLHTTGRTPKGIAEPL